MAGRNLKYSIFVHQKMSTARTQANTQFCPLHIGTIPFLPFQGSDDCKLFRQRQKHRPAL